MIFGGKSMTKKPLVQTLGEEIANSISHGVGSLLAVAATVILIVKAAIHNGALSVVSVSLYGASMIVLYSFSSLYHAITHKTAKKVMRIFDHCSIFLLILGTYIPVSLLLIGGAKGWVLFGVNTFCAVLGIVFNAINMEKWKKPSMLLYIIMGWSIIFSMSDVIKNTSPSGLVFLVVGGIMYTLGIIFYKNKKTKYMHFIWHLFVLAGSILHFFFVLLYCL